MRRRRWKSRNVTGKSKKRMVLLMFLLFSLLSMQSFIFIEHNLREPMMEIADVRVKQIATEAINTAVSEKISQNAELDKLIDWQYDYSGKITGFMLNYAEHMKIANDTINTVQGVLQKLTQRKEYVPLGQAFNSAILASFGPDIPIRIVPAGAVKVDLNTKQINAGINMLLVEVYIRVIEEVSIIIPFETKPEVVSTDIPITYLLVKGDVPMYYYDGRGNPLGNSQPLPPTLALPDQSQNQSKYQSSQGSNPSNSGSGTNSSLPNGVSTEEQRNNVFNTAQPPSITSP